MLDPSCNSIRLRRNSTLGRTLPRLYSLSSPPTFERPREKTMPRILSDVLLDESAVRRLEALPGVTVRMLPPHESEWELPDGRARAVSSMARSGERRGLEELAIATALREQVDRLRERGEWTKLKCIELLLVRGWANRGRILALRHAWQTVDPAALETWRRAGAVPRKSIVAVCPLG